MLKIEKEKGKKEEKRRCDTSIIAFVTAIFKLVITIINLIHKIAN